MRKVRIAVSACAILALVCGCPGQTGPERYDITGAATFDGQPIPAGVISFEPDTSKGNGGPGTMARIKNGRYKSDPGEGIVGGAYILRIYGYDGKPETGTQAYPEGDAIFEMGYRMEADLPAEGGTFDVHVPASAADKM